MVEPWELDESGKEVAEVPSALKIIVQEAQEDWAKYKE